MKLNRFRSGGDTVPLRKYKTQAYILASCSYKVILNKLKVMLITKIEAKRRVAWTPSC